MLHKQTSLRGTIVACALVASFPAAAHSISSDTTANTRPEAFLSAADKAVRYGRLSAARSELERAETAFLNDAEYGGQLKIVPGTGAVLTGKLADVAAARQSLAAKDVKQTRAELAAAR